MSCRSALFAVLLLACVAAFAHAQESDDVQAIIDELPSGEDWLEHYTNDLLPFWDMPDAWGQPVGNFPTFRCEVSFFSDLAVTRVSLSDCAGAISVWLF